MKKIAIVAQCLSNGGAERVASILANYLSNKGYEVLYIAAYYEDKEYHLDESIKYVAISTTGKSGVTRLLDRNVKILNEIKKFKPQLVYSFITNELLFTQFAGFPVVHSLRNDPMHIDNSFVARNLRLVAYHLAKSIVFQTQGARDFFGRRIREKGVVIANPVDIDKLPNWNWKNKNTFMTACRLTEQKNLPMMIRAFEKLHSLYSDFYLDIYGEGELKESLTDLIEDLGAQEYITLKGRCTEIYEKMAEAYAFVLSSDYEGLSNSMLEALCIGVPCICTDCPPGGARSVIENGKNGILVPVGDVDKLFEAMKLFVEKPGVRKELSLNCRNTKADLRKEEICAQWELLIS